MPDRGRYVAKCCIRYMLGVNACSVPASCIPIALGLEHILVSALISFPPARLCKVLFTLSHSSLKQINTIRHDRHLAQHYTILHDTMALLRSQMEYAHRLENKEFQWQDGTDDLFDSFINPDSFHLGANNAATMGQRKFSNDLMGFFETHASSSGSDSLDLSTIPDLDGHSNAAWQSQYSALSFEQQQDEAFNEKFNRHLSIYSNGRASCSETDGIVLPTDDVEEDLPHAVTAPSTPRWRTKTRRPTDTPLTIRKRQLSASPSKTAKIEKQQRRVTTMRRMSPHKASHSGSQLTKRFQDAAATGQLDVKVPASSYRMATPPPSTHLRSTSFDWDLDEERKAVRSPGLFVDDEFDHDHDHDNDHPMSPTSSSNGYSRLQHHNTPADETPLSTIHPRLRSPARSTHVTAEPHALAPTSYASSPLSPQVESFALTPPPTGPMNHAPWSPGNELSFLQVGSPSPSGKAEGAGWADFTGGVVDPSQVTCGAHARGGVALQGVIEDGGFGLGISGVKGGVHGQEEHGFYTPRKRHGLMVQQQQNGMASRGNIPLSGDIDSATLTMSPQQSLYPMSPLLGSHHHGMSSYTLSTPPRPQQGIPHFSPTPAQMQARQTYRPSHHQRSHTVGAPIASIPPSMLTQPASAFASLSFPQLPPSPSPPLPSRTSPHRGTTQTSPFHPRQRSKSAHHSRRKSTGAPSNGHHRQSSQAASSGGGGCGGGFVNFTPSDSKKILTGVAPSGSSKTKARREKEAAEKRRKLSLAAKRAILEAGGDLAALEREVMALGGED